VARPVHRVAQKNPEIRLVHGHLFFDPFSGNTAKSDVEIRQHRHAQSGPGGHHPGCDFEPGCLKPHVQEQKKKDSGKPVSHVSFLCREVVRVPAGEVRRGKSHYSGYHRMILGATCRVFGRPGPDSVAKWLDPIAARDIGVIMDVNFDRT
jgi:hypothetical protein